MEIGEIREEIEQTETEKEKDGDFKIPGKKRTRKRSRGVTAKKRNTEAEEGGIVGVGTGVKEREAERKGVEERRPATRWSVLAASSVTEESSESESEREGGLTDSSLAAESSASQSGSGPAGGYELEKVREFLQKTKGKKNVVVEEYFPNISLFKATIRVLLKKNTSSEGLSDQEKWRLKNVLAKLKCNEG